MKYYCPNCGFGMEYTFEKPKQCTKCNISFGSVFVIKKTELPKRDTVKDEESLVEDIDNPDIEIPKLDKVAVELEGVQLKEKKITVASIFEEVKSLKAPPIDISRDKPTQKVSKKKFLADFQKRAGSLRGGGSKTHKLKK